MKPASQSYLNGFVEMLGRSRIPCRIFDLSEGGARLELLERAHLLPTIGLRIAESHRVLECNVTLVDRDRANITFKALDGVEAAAARRTIRKALDQLARVN